jgi:hypothetical protein
MAGYQVGFTYIADIIYGILNSLLVSIVYLHFLASGNTGCDHNFSSLKTSKDFDLHIPSSSNPHPRPLLGLSPSFL